MSEYSSLRDLAKYLATAREHLSEDKVRSFEEVYLRMQARADRWAPIAAAIESACDRPRSDGISIPIDGA